MIGSEDPEYIVSEEEVHERADRDVHVRERARGASAAPNRATTSSPRCSTPRSTATRCREMDFNLFFLLIAVAGNETTRNSISHGIQRVLRLPRPVPAARRRPVARAHRRPRRSCAGRRRSCTSAATSRATPSCAASSSKAGDKVSIWYISANRDEDVFDDPFTFDILRDAQRARRLRRRRPAPLPRRQPRPHGDLRAARGDGAPHADARARRRRRSRCARNFIAGIKHMPVKFPKGPRESN